MREFRTYSSIDNLSKELNDPINLSQILLKQKIIVANRRADFNSFINDLKNRSIDFLKKKNIIYTVVKQIDDHWVVRGVFVGLTIISIYFEDNTGGSRLYGLDAYEQVIRNIQVSNPFVKYTIGSIPVEHLPESIRDIVLNTIEQVLTTQPPNIWLNKYIYDIYIEKLISDKGGYLYVLLGRDKFNKKYAVKIPRERTINGKPLAVSSNSSTIVEVFKGVINCLEVSQITRDDLKRGLILFGYEEALADELLIYKKYILKPRAFIMFRDIYSIDDYFETPPVIVEDYADKGDLDSRVRVKPLDERELIYVAIRLSGALSLIHIVRLLHMDIKPQNILLISDDTEPYGYIPLLSDLVGSPHIYDKSIELKKSTPEYAEPVSLISGRVDFAYDVYSLGSTLFYTVTGKKLHGRTLVNIVALKEIYGVPVPLKTYLIDNPELAKHYSVVEQLFKSFRNKSISNHELLESLINIINEIDSEVINSVNKVLSSEVSSIIIKAISLDKSIRYPDAVLFWKNLIEAIKDRGYLNLIPVKSI